MSSDEVYFYLTVHQAVTIQAPVKHSVTITSTMWRVLTKILGIVRSLTVRLEA
jgi:hypothetical protein